VPVFQDAGKVRVPGRAVSSFGTPSRPVPGHLSRQLTQSRLRRSNATGPPIAFPKRTPERISTSSFSICIRSPRPYPTCRRANSRLISSARTGRPAGPLDDRDQGRAVGLSGGPEREVSDGLPPLNEKRHPDGTARVPDGCRPDRVQEALAWIGSCFRILGVMKISTPGSGSSFLFVRNRYPRTGIFREPWQAGCALVARDLEDPADDRRLAVADQDPPCRLLLVDRRSIRTGSHIPLESFFTSTFIDTRPSGVMCGVTFRLRTAVDELHVRSRGGRRWSTGSASLFDDGFLVVGRHGPSAKR